MQTKSGFSTPSTCRTRAAHVLNAALYVGDHHLLGTLPYCSSESGRRRWAEKIRLAGLVSSLEDQGLTVLHRGISTVDDLTGEIGRSTGLLREISAAVMEATYRSSLPLVVAGNCMTSVGVAYVLGPESISIVCFFPYEDLHTLSMSTSGYFDGMVWPLPAG